MKKSDLKVGYVVKTRDGYLRMLVPIKFCGLVFMRKTCQVLMYKDYTEDLTDTDGDAQYDIMEVWGFSEANAFDVSTDDRDLLWKREPKKMTVSEICKELGYDVEIVKEGEK